MSLYLTVPINENGVTYDTHISSIIDQAFGPAPFGFEDVYIYSHGWSTNAVWALNEYNRFSVELAKLVAQLDQSAPNPFANPPKESIGVGIHWPSEITEDVNSPLNNLQLFTFYTMEKRADQVGQHGVYAILRLILQNRAAVTSLPLRINLLGHSFGCKVVASALQAIHDDIASGTIALQLDTAFNVVLLQGAFDKTYLEGGQCYGDVQRLQNLRMMITWSAADRALNEWFRDAHRLASLFKTPAAAMGAGGPSAPTVAQFGTHFNLAVAPGMTHTALAGRQERLLVADLSAVHASHPGYEGDFSGHHSDINFPELYEVIAGFLYGIA